MRAVPEGWRGLAQRNLRSPAASFAAAMYFSLGINLVQGVLLARLLGREQYGVWISLMLLLNYGQNYHLGAVQSVNRRLPLLRGQGRPEAALDVASVARGQIVMATFGWALLGWLLVRSFYGAYPAGGAVFVALVAVEAWWLLGQVELQTAHRFGTAALTTVGRNLLNLALLVLVARWGIEGAYARWAVVLAVSLVWVWKVNPVRAPLRFSARGMRAMIADGAPILAVSVLFAFVTSLDRTMLYVMHGAAAMENYAVATILMTLMVVLPGAVGQTSYPRMLEQFGRSGVVAELWPGVLSRVGKVGALSLVAAAVGYFAIPLGVRWVLPEYVDGIRPAQWLLPGGVFVAASVPCSYLMQVVRRQRLLVTLHLCALLVQGTLCYLVLRQGADVVRLAQANALGLAIYCVIVVSAGFVVGRDRRVHA